MIRGEIGGGGSLGAGGGDGDGSGAGGDEDTGDLTSVPPPSCRPRFFSSKGKIGGEEGLNFFSSDGSPIIC